jgi:arylsulfatase A-like enzyme
MNILYIMFDRLRFYHRRTPDSEAPNIDRIAAMGVRFSNATPNLRVRRRASAYTGAMSSCGAQWNSLRRGEDLTESAM